MLPEETRREIKNSAVAKEIESRFERGKRDMLEAFRGMNATQRDAAMQSLMKGLSESFV